MIGGRPHTIIGNKQVLDEIHRLSLLPYNQYAYDNLTVQDLVPLQRMVEQDAYAHDFMDEAVWLLNHHEYEHVGHSLYYLQEYVTTGEDDVCIPHELSHIRVYLKYQDFGLVEAQTKVVEKYEQSWLDAGKKRYTKFPQYYVKFEEIKPKIDEVVMRLKAQEYDQKTADLLEYIDENQIC